MPHELLNAWSRFKPKATPYLLDGDEVLDEPEIAKKHVALLTWNRLIHDPEFGRRDGKLHLSLIPQPFCGSIATAPVVILTLNPGLRPIDYYGESFVPKYRRALVRNLRQSSGREPHLFLTPEFSWHSGFGYWHGRLAGLIDSFAAKTSIPRIDALAYFARSIATLELVPYHSARFELPARVVARLRSAQLAKSFVHDVLLPKAKASETLLVVARKSKQWDLVPKRNVIVYRGGETRGALLTPNSRGGGAILGRLLEKWELAH